MWTLDCSVALPSDGSVGEVVQLVIGCRRESLGYDKSPSTGLDVALSDLAAHFVLMQLVCSRVVHGRRRHETSFVHRRPDLTPGDTSRTVSPGCSVVAWGWGGER